MRTNPILIVALFVLVVPFLYAQNAKTRHAVYSGEQALRVSVEGGYGTVHIRRTTGDKVYVFTEKGDADAPLNASVKYKTASGKGYLKIELNTREDEDEDFIESLACLVKGHASGNYYLDLTDRIPIDLAFELGAGEARLDLTGLKITGMNLETGASDMHVITREQNTVPMRTATISAGVGNVKAEGLGFLNFEHLTFEGGLGSCHLDLSGEMRNDASVSAEIGMGSLIIVLPKDLGVRMKSNDSFLSRTNYHRFIRMNDDTYETPAYLGATRRISMNINSGIGSVSVKWKRC
jgi:hypothetical protein